MEYLKNTAKLKTIDINAIHTWGNGVILETARAFKHEIVYNISHRFASERFNIHMDIFEPPVFKYLVNFSVLLIMAREWHNYGYAPEVFSSDDIETNVYKYFWPYGNAPDRDYEYFEPELYELYAGGFDKYIYYAKECAGVNSRKLLEEALRVAKI